MRLRRVADRWERWLEHIHTDIPLDELPEPEEAEQSDPAI